jgi:class 3 adenylate cyclase
MPADAYNMGEQAPPRRGVSFSLRVKIILAFCLLSALVSLALALSTYLILNRNLFRELSSRVRDLSNIGSLTLDRGAIERLAARVAAGLREEEVAEIESGQDFHRISDSLNRIRGVEPKLVRFIYTFVPTADPNAAFFLVDGDILLAGSTRPNGELIEEEDLSHFASEFDISDFPVARQAIAEKRNLVESEYTYDEASKVTSVSGYAPVLAADGHTLLAVLGLDMVDTDVRSLLNHTTFLSLAVAAAALLLAIATSIGIGTAFTHGIISLDRVMRSFDERNMGVRAQVRTRDEVGRLGLSFNQMAGLIQRHSDETRATLEAYGRFVPHEFLFFLEKKSITEVKLGDQVLKEMTILFSDIRSFTELSESMTPQENFNFLNSYLSRIGPEIRSNNGFIDKYIGDAIMALFPEKPDDAVRAALSMRAKLVEYNLHRASSGYAPIAVGIAINTGKLMMGTLGEQERMDGSVISDAVNLASRLEGLSRLYGDTILITGPTLSLLEGRRDFHTRFIDRVRVRGRKEAVLIYEVYDWETPERIELRQSLKAGWSQAMNHYYGREFEPAFLLLRKLYEQDPRDRIAELYLRRATALIKRGAPQGWEGVEVIDAK